MPMGNLYAMPLLIINLGGEMLYILQQRLSAQNVAKTRSRKVLQDVLRTMYSNTFISELFKPQEMYSNSSTRQIFNKLAHSSIMRINETSMEKLYDLMTMGVKYQFLCCNCPQQMIQVTMNHLHSMRQVSMDSDVHPLIENVFDLVSDTYSGLANGDWLLLKQSIFQFFQGRKVKVSLFLQANLQHMNGTLVLLHTGPVARGSEVPGDVTYYDSSGKGSRVAEFEALHGAGSCDDACKTFFDPSFSLGINIYLSSKKEVKEELAKFWEEDQKIEKMISLMMINGGSSSLDHERMEEAKALRKMSSSGGGGGDAKEEQVPQERRKSAARPRRGSLNELNMLASLMGSAVEKTEGESENGTEAEAKDDYKPIKMNFDTLIGNFGGDGNNNNSNNEVEENLITTQKIDGRLRRSSMDDRMASLGFALENLEKAEAKIGEGDEDIGEEKDGNGGSDSEDDLLDMLDMVDDMEAK